MSKERYFHNEILYLMDFVSAVPPSEEYVVRFECTNYIWVTYSLYLEFNRKGYKSNEVQICRESWRPLRVYVGGRYNPENTVDIESDWIGEALLAAQQELAIMPWIPLKSEQND